MSKSVTRLLAVFASVLIATAAAAAPKNFTHANGGVTLSDPGLLQFVSFSVFDYGATGDRGHVTYTNFDALAPGSGVWSLDATVPLTFAIGTSTYAHTMTIDQITPTSNDSFTFTGTGVYDADPTVTWNVSGMVSGSTVTFTIVYTGTGAPYTVTGTGTIAADGSISGTATDSALQSLTFTTPAGSAQEVLSYTASVSCAVVTATDATFVFTVPDGLGLDGTVVIARVHDGGKPKDHLDTYGHTTTATGVCDPAAAVTNYTIVDGNIVVH
jgi:hypothetical protein